MVILIILIVLGALMGPGSSSGVSTTTFCWAYSLDNNDTSTFMLGGSQKGSQGSSKDSSKVGATSYLADSGGDDNNGGGKDKCLYTLYPLGGRRFFTW